MVREIDITFWDMDRIQISSDQWCGIYDGRLLYVGDQDDDEATRLSLAFSSEFDDYTMTLILEAGETEYEVASGTDDFDYDIENEYLIPEIVIAKIKAVYGTQILYSRDINLEVSR